MNILSSVGNYMFKVNNRNTRARCEICSKLTIKTPERRLLARGQMCLYLLELLLTLNQFCWRNCKRTRYECTFFVYFFLFISQASKGLQLSPVEVIANSLPNIIPNVLLNKREVSEIRAYFCNFAVIIQL